MRSGPAAPDGVAGIHPCYGRSLPLAPGTVSWH